MRTILLLLLAVTLARAEDLYVSQNGAGSQDGTSTNNAYSLAWLNTSGNWGSGAGKVSAGDTVRFSGLFTNQARFWAGGTLGNRITFLAEPGCRWVGSVEPYIFSASAICLSNFSNINVDGGIDGRIEYTDNGTFLTYQIGAHGIQGNPSGGEITIANWKMTNIYVWDSPNTASNYTVPGSGVYLGCGIASNIVVHNVTVDNAASGVFAGYAGGGMSFAWEFYSNVTVRCNWGIAGGDGVANSQLNGLRQHHNRDSEKSEWDQGGLGDGNHHNGTYFWANQSGSSISNVFYCANWYDPKNTPATSCIFLSSSGNGVWHINIYNCVFLAYPGPPITISIFGGGHSRVFNNTFMGDNGSVFLRWLAMTGVLAAQNNLFFNIGNPMATPDDIRTGATLFVNDYNSFYSLNPFGGVWGDSGQYTLAQWQATPYDTHSITSNPLLVSTNNPYNAHIQSGSPAIGAGTDVSSLLFPGQNVDFDGVARPTLPAIGAFEFQAASSPAVAAKVTLTGRQTWSGGVRLSTQ